jgi:hypothetical protein
MKQRTGKHSYSSYRTVPRLYDDSPELRFGDYKTRVDMKETKKKQNRERLGEIFVPSLDRFFG